MPNAGDVVWLEFPGVNATKRRPAVILSTDEYHKLRPDVIVGLVTSQVAKAAGPTDHLLSDWRLAGLRVPSSFRAFVTTLPQTAVMRKMGHLGDADWQSVRQCLKRSLVV